MQRLRSIASPVLAPTSGRDRVTHGTHYPDPSPKSDFTASDHYARAAKVLESGRIGASLGLYHFPAKRVQNGPRMANGAHTAPPPRIFSHSLTIYNIYTCCAWLGLEMGPASGRKSYLAMFGGSSDGDDQLVNEQNGLFLVSIDLGRVILSDGQAGMLTAAQMSIKCIQPPGGPLSYRL